MIVVYVCHDARVIKCKKGNVNSQRGGIIVMERVQVTIDRCFRGGSLECGCM